MSKKVKKEYSEEELGAILNELLKDVVIIEDDDEEIKGEKSSESKASDTTEDATGENREIFLIGELEEEDIDIIQDIIEWNRNDKKDNIPVEERKPIILYFNSPGGDLSVYRTVSDVIRASKTPVYGVNLGACSSAAALIFMNCHKRLALPKSYFLLHEGGGKFEGGFRDLCDNFEFYKIEVENFSKEIADRTNFTMEEINVNIKKEWFVNTETALSRKLIDMILTDIDDIL